MKIGFWKMSGAGNDFVLLNGLPRGRSGAALALRLCDRRFGVGADGLLVLSRRRGRVRMDYWNADGSSTFCGNGARCSAVWAHRQGWVKTRRFQLDTCNGVLDAAITGPERAEMAMPPPGRVRRLKLSASLLRIQSVDNSVYAVNTGAPHAVVFVKDVDRVDVKVLGQTLRRRHGANVDFVSIHKGALALRTFERGVEDETLACGTGAVAAAAVAHSLGKTKARVTVHVLGGTLRVSLSNGAARLEGLGEITFTGEASA
jgi:diaminopimelate epimerase